MLESYEIGITVISILLEKALPSKHPCRIRVDGSDTRRVLYTDYICRNRNSKSLKQKICYEHYTRHYRRWISNSITKDNTVRNIIVDVFSRRVYRLLWKILLMLPLSYNTYSHFRWGAKILLKIFNLKTSIDVIADKIVQVRELDKPVSSLTLPIFLKTTLMSRLKSVIIKLANIRVFLSSWCKHYL